MDVWGPGKILDEKAPASVSGSLALFPDSLLSFFGVNVLCLLLFASTSLRNESSSVLGFAAYANIDFSLTLTRGNRGTLRRGYRGTMESVRETSPWESWRGWGQKYASTKHERPEEKFSSSGSEATGHSGDHANAPADRRLCSQLVDCQRQIQEGKEGIDAQGLCIHHARSGKKS